MKEQVKDGQLLNILCLFVMVGLRVEAVDFKDQGYHLFVAINKDVPENIGIISELQSMLTSASDYLYTATRKYTYIRRVTILVPATWTRDPAWELEGEMIFTRADIRVDEPHPAMGNSPYVFQPGQCGDPGRYIHLTSDFVLDNQIDRQINYGDAGRVLVHEFAHLRYGVFGEYGVRDSLQHPVYYIDDNSTILRPTACSAEVVGVFHDVVNGGDCATGDTSTPLNENCIFLPSTTDNVATASVMYAQFLQEVTEFCESNPQDKKRKHNADAPNRQNKMCNKRGTWDVIREHLDIRGH
ncbi:calcium-activated chloride channel regulator 3A-1-like [Haliotis rufescens]|uniref:calcium-activated chloride channel regulator 3A-1-like n=1 Tax=Haliotis rufescens TaxID=6454 RepID=UPI00201F4FB8|nr:calcium-activated chloride channel regulator 3A-1-like [Haliotis rufescens]